MGRGIFIAIVTLSLVSPSVVLSVAWLIGFLQVHIHRAYARLSFDTVKNHLLNQRRA